MQLTDQRMRDALVAAFQREPVVNDAWTSGTDDWTEARQDEAARMADVALAAIAGLVAGADGIAS